MTGGKSACTRSATGGRIGRRTTIRNDYNDVSQQNTHSIKEFQIRFDEIVRKREKQFQDHRKQFQKELTDTKEKVRELEQEVEELKDKVLKVEEYKQELTKLRNDYHKLQFELQGMGESNSDRNKTDVKEIQNSIQPTIQTYIKENIYRDLKFVEYDHLTPIYHILVKRPEHKIPDGIDEEEYKKIVITCIKKAFSNLRHNSQTLIRRNYLGE